MSLHHFELFDNYFDNAQHDFIVCNVDKNGKQTVNLNKTLTSLATTITEYYDLICIKGGEILYVWNGTYYEGNIISELRNYIEIIFTENGMAYHTRHGNELIQRIKDRRIIEGDTTNLNDDHIPFLNGYLNLVTGELEDPDPELRCLYCIPHNYNMSAVSVLFEDKIKQIIPQDHLRKYVLTYMAYCLTNSIEFHKALMLYGPGGNGKSVICEVLKVILGEKLYTLIPLQTMGARFNQVRYLGKLANIADDIPKRGLEDASFFKMMVSNKSLDGEIKNKMGFTYRNTTKSFNSCNECPGAPEAASDGFYRRWAIIPLTEKFDPTLKNVDTTLVEKLTQESEIEGIINILIRYIPHLDYLHSIGINDSRKKWSIYGDSPTSFFKQCINTETRQQIKCSYLFKLYKLWCEIDQKKIRSQKLFGQRLSESGVERSKKKGMEKVPGQPDPAPYHFWVYENIYPKFKPDEEDAMGIFMNEWGYYRYKESEEMKAQKTIDSFSELKDKDIEELEKSDPQPKFNPEMTIKIERMLQKYHTQFGPEEWLDRYDIIEPLLSESDSVGVPFSKEELQDAINNMISKNQIQEEKGKIRRITNSLKSHITNNKYYQKI